MPAAQGLLRTSRPLGGISLLVHALTEGPGTDKGSLRRSHEMQTLKQQDEQLLGMDVPHRPECWFKSQPRPHGAAWLSPSLGHSGSESSDGTFVCLSPSPAPSGALPSK